jgi:hypothetical protein
LFSTHFPTVARHEFGHALGLGHSTSTQAVMTPGAYGWIAIINSDDTAGVKSLYGLYTGEGFVASPAQPALGQTVALELDYLSSAGKEYIVVASLVDSGGVPFHPFWPGDSRYLLVSTPFLTQLPLLTGFYGQLDVLGRATAHFKVPFKSHAGLQVHFAALTFDQPILSLPLDANSVLDTSVLATVTLP